MPRRYSKKSLARAKDKARTALAGAPFFPHRITAIAPSSDAIYAVVLTESGAILRYESFPSPIVRIRWLDPALVSASTTFRRRDDAYCMQRMLLAANELVALCKATISERIAIALPPYQLSRDLMFCFGELSGTIRSQLFLATGILPELVDASLAANYVSGHNATSRQRFIAAARTRFRFDCPDEFLLAAAVARFYFDSLARSEPAERKPLNDPSNQPISIITPTSQAKSNA